MQVRCKSTGRLITLQEKTLLAEGGEARIYPVPHDRALLAKIYKNPNPQRVRKLPIMLANPPDDPMRAQGGVSIAWPVDILETTDRLSRVVGFLMPRVKDVRPVFEYYNPKSRQAHCPQFDYRYLHRTARNLAAAVAALHARGYVVGDLNQSNILVSQRALVTLVDTDSFQVRDPQSGEVLRCLVGKPEFTPPELYGCRFSEVDRRVEHDLFGLAILIFQLLMEGTHPFAGVFLGPGDPPPYEERIRAGDFPYGTSRKLPYAPMPFAPPWELLHPTVRALFIRCFEDGYRCPTARPDATCWRSALDEIEACFTRCTRNAQHWYGNHLASCPWCERTQRLGGYDPFPTRGVLGRAVHPRRRPLPRPLPPARPSPRRPAPAAGWPKWARHPWVVRLAAWVRVAFAYLVAALIHLWHWAVQFYDIIERIPAVVAAMLGFLALLAYYYYPHSLVYRKFPSPEIERQIEALEKHIHPSEFQAPGPSQPGTVSPPRVENSSTGLTVHLDREVSIELVRIPPGSFVMGADDGNDSERPAHRIRITRPFYLAKHEITQQQWTAVMGQSPGNYRGPSYPVTNVSWIECVEFAARLTARVKPYPIHFRLPTEAEWEYACRAGSSAKWSFGDDSRLLGQFAWYADNSGGAAHPVGQKNPNAWKLYDMHGNVAEWCQDWFDGHYYRRSPPDDPIGPFKGTGRVIRGGSAGDWPPNTRSAFRYQANPDYRMETVGFRIAATAAEGWR